MENTSYWEYLKLNDDQHGILVTSVEQACILSKVLKENDVITAIDNVPIVDDGTIYFRLTFTIIRQGNKDRKYTFICIRSIEH
ncbi:unnamed protein product [Rotaria sp. Silwood1]|nr:unnamed protein product [Rotaria sp. Silwood1]